MQDGFGKMTTATREKALAKRKETQKVKEKYKLTGMAKAIRLECLDCQCGSSPQVKFCHISTCPLWAYRFGRKPTESDLKVPEFDKYGNLTNETDLLEFNRLQKLET